MLNTFAYPQASVPLVPHPRNFATDSNHHKSKCRKIVTVCYPAPTDTHIQHTPASKTQKHGRGRAELI